MKRILLVIAAIAVAITLFTLNGKDEDPREYIASIEKDRQEKDRFMSTSYDSPFRMYGDTTVHLNYYPADPAYKLTARIELIEKPQYLTLGTSDGSSIKYRKYAYAHFALGEASHKLLILQDPQAKQGGLFTAFADETSADETYGAGRYLDLDFKRANRITLDFNKAYNPYCIYNHTYSCPFPPRENMLPIAIKAGEKSYQ